MKITNLNQIDYDNTACNNMFSVDIEKGLSLKNKALSSKYFYDDIGSKLFQKITKHSDYYLTKKEIEILNSIKTKLPKLLKLKEIDIIELGPGDGTKSKIIIEGFIECNYAVNYYPIDISKKALHLLKNNIKKNDKLNIHGIVGEYIDGLKFIKKNSKNKQLVLFLGSNIGNFERIHSIQFMKKIKNSIKKDSYVFVGFDLKKKIKILNKAYNDSSNLTKKFNLNLLKRINTELKGNFNINKFVHYGVYNPLLGAMESFIISTVKQTIYLEKLQKSFYFDMYEPIHLEYSFKFSVKDIENVAFNSGFKVEQNFNDKNGYFIDSLWLNNY